MTQQPKSYLSPADVSRIKSELAELEARRNATNDAPTDHFGFFRPSEVTIDDSAIIRRENQLKRTLEKESPPEVSGYEKTRSWREFKTLVKEWEDTAITKFDQGLGYPEIMKKRTDAESDYENAKRKCLREFSPRGQWVANRLKELAGVIDPSNPDLRNLENFRRAR